MRKQEIRPFTDGVYALVVLQSLKRTLKRSDYYLAYMPPNNVLSDVADRSEVQDALDYAISIMSEHLASEAEQGASDA